VLLSFPWLQRYIFSSAYPPSGIILFYFFLLFDYLCRQKGHTRQRQMQVIFLDEKIFPPLFLALHDIYATFVHEIIIT